MNMIKTINNIINNNTIINKKETKMNNMRTKNSCGILRTILSCLWKAKVAARPVVEKSAALRNELKMPARQANVRPVFTAGQVVAATVKRVDATTAYFSVRGASSAVVSAKACVKSGSVPFGNLVVGQQVHVCVKAWYPQTRQLVLSGVKEIVRAVKAKNPTVCKKASASNYTARTTKPDYEPLPKGTVILVDGANLLHEFEPAEAPKVMRSVVDGLKEQGYDARIYLEHRAWKFFSFNQGSEEAGERFKSLCRELDVTIVGREADCAILQTMGSIANSVGLTNDRYADYAKAFPDIVGSSRLRGFSVTNIADKKLLSVDGLSKAVTVAEKVGQKELVSEVQTAEETASEEAVAERPSVVRNFTQAVKGGFCGYGNVLLSKGNVQGAIRCFKKSIARHQAEGYAGLAEICKHNGDVNSAKRYAQLGEKLSRRLREREIRNRRIAAERHRIGSSCYAKCA